MKLPAPPAAIKWTDEEWGRIADKLHGEKGDPLLVSEDLEEIKARDVFEAQQVLPPERHRKLISIAQGFQGIRARLQGIFRKMQADGVSLQSAPAPDGAAPPEEAIPTPDGAAQQVLALQAATESAPQPQPILQPPLPAEAIEQPPAPEAAAQPSAPIPQPPAAVRAPAGGETAATPAQAPAEVQATAEAAAAKSDFIELARPFVAMVCEEFAKALAKTLAEQPGLAALAGMKAETPPPPPSRAREGNARPRPQQIEAAPAQAPRPSVAPESFEEDPAHPAEVQPLFDPKLPPSANSDFKPTIGLVATRAHEYEDLQMLYPQLQLCIVQADALRGPEAFRNCQRIIGLRDEVPPGIDDMLRRGLRHRYVRLSGGAARVREQLNSWLDKPGSINSTPRAQPRNDKRQGVPGKKRHKWPPRADR